MFEQEDNDDGVTMHYSYFAKQALRFEIEGSYAARDEKVSHGVEYIWMHPLSEIINSLIGAGLVVKSLNEYPYLTYKKFACMTEVETGWWSIPDSPGMPLLFSLEAEKGRANH